MNFEKLIKSAETSSFGLWKLNFLLHRFIPFNKPHGLKIKTISKHQVQVILPYQKSNLNHIKGLHACSLATAAEYASGLLLLYKLGIKEYRIIMESIDVNYHYQGKSTATAIYELRNEVFKNEILDILKKEGKVIKLCEIEVFDQEKNKLCTVRTKWQIKNWNQVKTRVN